MITTDKLISLSFAALRAGKMEIRPGQSQLLAFMSRVAPGFINMLSWSTESLIIDGKSQSEIRQGVTLEIMGEGTSMGPLSAKMKAERKHAILSEADASYTVEWTTLDEYLQFLERRGVSGGAASPLGLGF